MHQNGQLSAVLRLDPPGLGTVSVHIAMGESAQVNVQFISSLPQTAQLLSNNVDQLRQAMASAGLQLGQAQVGGGGTGQSGGGGNQPQANPQPAAGLSRAIAADDAADGVRAYA